MGQNITIDKRSVCVDEWLKNSVQFDLRNIDISISNHIIVWKFFTDSLVQANRNDSNIHNPTQIHSRPVFIEMITGQQIFNPYQTYIVLFIKNKSTMKNVSHSKIPEALRQMLNSILVNIQQISYSVQIASINTKQPQKISQFSSDSHYSIYTYFGKYSTSDLQMHTLTKAYQLDQSIFSDAILSLLCSGKQLKNKKWNKAKVQNLFTDGQLELSELKLFSKIALVKNAILDTFKDQKLTIFQIKPKQNIITFKAPPSVSSIPAIGKLNLAKVNNFVNSSQSPNQDPSQKISSVKPPMLKLTLKPYEEVTYDQIAQQQTTGNIKFDIRATARHQLKMQKFEKQCNEIVDGLFVSGQRAAKDLQTLKKFQIQDIVNCAGDYCQNWFQNQGFNYLTLFLKDSQNQNIQCLFYRVIDFIENSKKNNRKVLIHCIQGISRSVSFCIAYMIFTYGYDYKKAEAFIKQKRGIASPNNGFMVELIQFHKRLYDKYNALPNPRVFMVSSHSKETPHLITARMIKHALFNEKKYIGLDCRTVYIIQTENIVYLWVGSKCDESQLQKYWSYAQEYIKKLQRYQHAPVKVKAISQGSQGSEFYKLWNLQQMPQLYQNDEYNNLFLDGQGAKAGNLRKYYQKQEDKQVANRLFIYPDYKNGLGVFQLEDLNGFCVLVHSQDRQHLKIFLWRDNNNENNEDSQSQFLDNVLRANYSEYQPENIDIEQETPAEHSENFLNCFS